jgi:hypothetical protein
MREKEFIRRVKLAIANFTEEKSNVGYMNGSNAKMEEFTFRRFFKLESSDDETLNFINRFGKEILIEEVKENTTK